MGQRRIAAGFPVIRRGGQEAGVRGRTPNEMRLTETPLQGEMLRGPCRPLSGVRDTHTATWGRTYVSIVCAAMLYLFEAEREGGGVGFEHEVVVFEILEHWIGD